jgi:hypothetical protein
MIIQCVKTYCYWLQDPMGSQQKAIKPNSKVDIQIVHFPRVF